MGQNEAEKAEPVEPAEDLDEQPTNLMLRAVMAAPKADRIPDDEGAEGRPATHLDDLEAVAVLPVAQAEVDDAEPRTSLYHPKVEVILARLDDELSFSPGIDDATDMTRHLRDKVADLWLLRDNYEDLEETAVRERTQLETAAGRMLDDLGEVIERAGELLTELQQDDGLTDDLEPARDEAVASFFKLRKLFGKEPLDAEEDVELNVERKLERKRQEAKQKRAKKVQPSNRRGLKVVVSVVLFLIAGMRVALLFVSTPSRPAATTFQRQSGKAVVTLNRQAVLGSELALGIPTMVLVDLFRDHRGALVANPVASHPKGEPISYRYAWLRDGVQIAKKKSRDRLQKNELTPGSYRAQVWALTDGKLSRPMLSAPLVIK